MWNWYKKNTFVRHAAIIIASLAILEWGERVSNLVSGWFTSEIVKIAIAGAIAVAIRWAQTHLELWIVKVRTERAEKTGYITS